MFASLDSYFLGGLFPLPDPESRPGTLLGQFGFDTGITLNFAVTRISISLPWDIADSGGRPISTAIVIAQRLQREGQGLAE